MKPEEVRKLFDKLEREVSPGHKFREGYREVRYQLMILRHNYPFLFRMIERLYHLERIL